MSLSELHSKRIRGCILIGVHDFCVQNHRCLIDVHNKRATFEIDIEIKLKKKCQIESCRCNCRYQMIPATFKLPFLLFYQALKPDYEDRYV